MPIGGQTSQHFPMLLPLRVRMRGRINADELYQSLREHTQIVSRVSDR